MFPTHNIFSDCDKRCGYDPWRSLRLLLFTLCPQLWMRSCGNLSVDFFRTLAGLTAMKALFIWRWWEMNFWILALIPCSNWPLLLLFLQASSPLARLLIKLSIFKLETSLYEHILLCEPTPHSSALSLKSLSGDQEIRDSCQVGQVRRKIWPSRGLDRTCSPVFKLFAK